MALRKFTSRKVGKNIKTIRLALNLSQTQFGLEAGNYSQDTVARWEIGQVPHALILKRIAEISHPPRSVDWILNRAIRLEKEQNLSKPFGQIVFDTLRQLIREEINAALKRVGSTAATKKAARQESRARRD